MRFFLDSAKMDEIQKGYELFRIDGITTNPRHIQSSGKPFYSVIKEIAAWGAKQGFKTWEDFPISVEVNPHFDKAVDMIAMAKELKAMSDLFVIKIPCTFAGVEAAHKLEEMDIRTNLTLVFSVSQALYAAHAGSLFVSPFVGWKEANGEDTRSYIEGIVSAYAQSDSDTQVLVAALRSGSQIAHAFESGADAVTCGLSVYEEAILHPYTDKGLGIFTSAWDGTDTSK
ncbi:MAG: transaldolase family protein [Brevinema sp.]